MQADVQLLLYDNHYKGPPYKQTDLLYRSATDIGVSFRVGSLLPASVRKWEAGDREEWLLRTLPDVNAKNVVLLDATDAVLFCDRAELIKKIQTLVPCLIH